MGNPPRLSTRTGIPRTHKGDMRTLNRLMTLWMLPCSAAPLLNIMPLPSRIPFFFDSLDLPGFIPYLEFLYHYSKCLSFLFSHFDFLNSPLIPLLIPVILLILIEFIKSSAKNSFARARVERL